LQEETASFAPLPEEAAAVARRDRHLEEREAEEAADRQHQEVKAPEARFPHPQQQEEEKAKLEQPKQQQQQQERQLAPCSISHLPARASSAAHPPSLSAAQLLPRERCLLPKPLWAPLPLHSHSP
jgi:hypothetical protein